MIKNNVFVESVAHFHLQLHNGAQSNGEILVESNLVLGEHADSRDCTDTYEKRTGSKQAIESCIGMETVETDPFVYPPLGFYSVMSNAMRGNTCKFSKVVFKDFPGTGTRCNTRAVRIYETHPKASDLIMQHIFSNIVLNNVSAETFVFLMDPPPGWVNLTDCVDFDCTAPENVLLSFVDGITQSGTTSITLPALPFDIISDNPGFKDALTGCTLNENWNANVCTGDDMAILEFESLDGDRFDRSVQPVYVSQG